MEYTHAKCTTEGLSDHTPFLITFPTYPRRKSTFISCEMFLIQISKALFTNKDSLNVREQQGIARRTLDVFQEQFQQNPRGADLIATEEESRPNYMRILHSSLSQMKQQSKVLWLNQGDICTRTFIAKMKQRQMQAYVYAIKDGLGQTVEGFSNVAQLILQLTGYQEGGLPFRYLGVPITANKLSKMECSMLVEKFTRRITTWATKSISYAGRVALINSVLIGVFNFWASIFISPKGVIKDLKKLCRNYLWGAEGEYKRTPHVKEKLREGSRTDQKWQWSSNKEGEYKVQFGYKWHMNTRKKPPWTRVTWSRISPPRHAFISWLLMKQKLLESAYLPERRGEYSAHTQTHQGTDYTEGFVYYTDSTQI
ncbi:hypothetical protein Cgig2_007561 [Carnegiea gigantea]|uniref:Reverse transcriptase zinc-binding domain-containing protein n=1 Tax=Carnegiea gigantea TaxID=171969 RepID=A0A9Q1GR61_9CARY|nr:hypothetical protein Cgig2_007561 [Carnegiea gigantea]